jgi:hypothetical protein
MRINVSHLHYFSSPATMPDLLQVSAAYGAVLADLQFSFVICCARSPDLPIVYASSNFFSCTGYSPQEVLGELLCLMTRVSLVAVAREPVPLAWQSGLPPGMLATAAYCTLCRSQLPLLARTRNKPPICDAGA